MLLGPWRGSALTRGDRVIAPSSNVALAMIERCGLSAEHITAIPRAIETATLSPAAVSADGIASPHRTWSLRPGRVGEIAGATGAALKLDATAYKTPNAHAAIRGFHVLGAESRALPKPSAMVYTSLPARDA